MAKEAYYFSHDSNARHDPKITAMRGVYGSEGYGWYWMIVEMMRESEGYKLDMQGKYVWNAFALQLHCECNRIEQFVKDCINEFNLFESDGKCFWSSSLLRRMDIREQKSEIRRKAAKARWDKEKQSSDATDENAKLMQMHSKSNANGMQGKESKVKESKGNKIKENNKTVFEDYTSNPALLDSLNSFVDFRKKIKKPMTERAIELLLGKLNKLASDETEKITILEQSILSGWQDVYALKNDFSSKYQSSKSPAGKNGKPQIPTVQSNTSEAISEEELAELRELARKFDQNGG